MRIKEMSTIKMRIPKAGTFEMHSMEVGQFEMGVPKDGGFQMRPVEVGAAQNCPPKIKTSPISSFQYAVLLAATHDHRQHSRDVSRRPLHGMPLTGFPPKFLAAPFGASSLFPKRIS